MLDSGFDQVLAGDPDRIGVAKLIIAYHPLFPLALGRIECAAGLDIDVRINMLESKPTMHCVELVFTGKCLDLSDLQMRLTAWAEQYPSIPAMPEEALYARQTPSAPSGASEGSPEPGI
jgi:hypothetical protein